jgi:hypothetical protein
MDNESLYVSIKQVLDFMEQGPDHDAYYFDKLSATIRRLNFYINQVECKELKDIIRNKMFGIVNKNKR